MIKALDGVGLDYLLEKVRDLGDFIKKTDLANNYNYVEDFKLKNNGGSDYDANGVLNILTSKNHIELSINYNPGVSGSVPKISQSKVYLGENSGRYLVLNIAKKETYVYIQNKNYIKKYYQRDHKSYPDNLIQLLFYIENENDFLIDIKYNKGLDQEPSLIIIDIQRYR